MAQTPTSAPLAALSLFQTKLLLAFLQHRERRQDRVLHRVSDQTFILALLARLPPLLYLRPQKAPVRQLPGIFSPLPTASSVPDKLSSYKPNFQSDDVTADSRVVWMEEPVSERPLVRFQSGKILVDNANSEFGSRNWVTTNRTRAKYQKTELGESPLRFQRSIRKDIPIYLQRSLPKSRKRRQGNKTKGGRTRHLPTRARRNADVKLVGKGLAKRVRWQEKRIPLIRQAFQERQNLFKTLGAMPGRQRGHQDKTNLFVPFQAKPASLPVTPSSREWVGLPYQFASLFSEPGRKLHKALPTARLYGPNVGPRLMPGGNHTARIRFVLSIPDSHYLRQDATRLFSKKESRDRARYVVRSERQQDVAEERHGESEFAARTSRRYRRGKTIRDRPYRAVRVGQFQLGRRPRPYLAARTRPFRRRDSISQQIQREATSFRNLSIGTKLMGTNVTRRLPVSKARQGERWARYVFGTDVRRAQERRQWWRSWHRIDPRIYGELRRAGSMFRDRAGRRNRGWWRSLVGVPRDSSFVRRGRWKTAYPLTRRSFYANRQRQPQVQPWQDRRTVPRGWASRLKDPKTLQQVLARDLQGRPDPRLPFWSLIPTAKTEDLVRAPFTVLWLYAAWRVRTKAYDSVQGDFLRARETILRRGGVREIDPEWRNWLLEALGISRANAGIRTYAPGSRSLSRHLAGLRRDLPALTDRLWYLRSSRRTRLSGRGPRPTLLVGAPGTGKTSLVRVLADEAGVPVVYQCLAAFTDAGARFTAFGFGRTVAPQAVQRGFAEARNSAPAILFLDEVDSLGANRGGVLEEAASSIAKDFQTPSQEVPEGSKVEGATPKSGLRTGDQVLGLGQLLVEIDNADKNKGLVLFAATNRPEELDPALVRPGRFDRTISVPLPNRSKRIAILKLYAGRFPNVGPLDWNYLAARTRGASAAHLASLTNRAAVSTRQTSDFVLSEAGFETALKRRRPLGNKGGTSPSMESTAKGGYSQLRKAYAAAAQALFFHVSDGPKLEWISRSDAVYPQTTYQRQTDRWKELRFYLLGYAAEWFLLNQTNELPDYWRSTLPQQNLRKATRVARRLLTSGGATFRNLQITSGQTQEFKKDAALLQYALENLQQKETVTNPRRHAYVNLQETLDWPTDWYSFEIAEVAGFRSVGWVPPELHLQGKGNTAKGEDHKLRQLRSNALNENLQRLAAHRVELDLLSQELRKHSTLTKRKRDELLIK